MPAIVYAHGLGDNKHNFEKLVQKLFPNHPRYGENGPEVKSVMYYSSGEGMVKDFAVDKNKLCLGQQGDIDTVIQACNTAIQKGEKSIIGFGASKGAATWINTLHYLHTHRTPENSKILTKIKAVIAIAPFADPYNCEMIAGFTGKGKSLIQRCALPGPFDIGRKVTRFGLKKVLPRFDLNGLFPIKSMKEMPRIPLFFVHSTQDDLIPVNHSRELYYAAYAENGRSGAAWLHEFAGGGHIH